MYRNIIGQSIIVLFTLASFFFVMIFLIGVADNTKTNNSIENQVPLQQSQVDRWGSIPGLLGYDFTRIVTIYSRQTYNSKQLNLNVEGPYELYTTRTFEDPQWQPTKSCIMYSMDYEYDGINQTQLDTIQLMPNLAGLSVWYQKTHKPTWWSAWQALTQVSNLMFTSNMLTRYYAYNAYGYIFNNQALVNEGVLNGMTTEQQNQVYTDPDFGMNTIFGLQFWVLANVGGSKSTAYQAIVSYYLKTYAFDITPFMSQIVGPKSILQFIIEEQKITLLNDKTLEQKVSLDEQNLEQQQWGQNSVLGNATFMMSGVPVLTSIADPIFDSNFVSPPEYGVYAQSKGLGSLVLSNSQVKLILNPSTSDYQTLLNPDNMRAFYKQYVEGGYSNIFTRYGFTSNAQVDLFVEYLDYIIASSLYQGSPVENAAFGQLLERTLNQTYATLNNTLQLEVTVRNMAQNINSHPGELDCNYYVAQAVTDQLQLNTICATYNFSDVEQLKLFVNASWYGGLYVDQLTAATAMDATQQAVFFDTAVPTSFGSYIVQYCGLIAVKYSCASIQNCTSTEIANLQWGSSGVTLQPINEDPNYTPKQNTTSNWGAWVMPGSTYPLEYYYYSKTKVALPSATVTRIQNNQVDYLGLLNMFNSIKYMNAYFTQNQTTLTTFQTNLQITDPSFPSNCIYFVQGWLLENAWVNYTSSQLLYGWESDIATKANGGDFWQGADFTLSNYITPILNDQIGPNANVPYGLYSGSFTTDNVSAYRLLNGEAYVNKIFKNWNGTFYTNIPQQPNDVLSNEDSYYFNTASNGIQFPPAMNQSAISVFDDRLLTINNFQYSKTKQYTPTVLDIQVYNGEWVGGLDVGFTFNLPFFEHSANCGDCVQTSQQIQTGYNVQIQGHNWVWQTSNSTNAIEVQPDTGFMSEMYKDSTMVMLLEYYTNSSQAMQPSGYQPFPFPDLTPLIGIQFPVYDLTDKIAADQTAFLNQVGYVADNTSKVRTATIWMITMCSLFFILGVVAAIIYKVKAPKDGERRDSEVAQAERDEQIAFLKQD